MTEADYSKWGTLEFNSVSDKGKWASYSMTYESGNDTLFLQRTDSTKLFAFSNGVNSRFAGEESFAYLIGKELKIFDLKHNTTEIVMNVSRYEFTETNKFLVTLHQDNVLQLRELQSTKIKSIPNTYDYKLSPDGRIIMVGYKAQENYIMEYIELQNYKRTPIARSGKPFGRITWQQNSGAVVFENGKEVFHFSSKERKLHSITVEAIAGAGNRELAQGGLNPITVSDDGDKVFFSVAKSVAVFPNNIEASVEVWNGNDKCLYPAREAQALSPFPRLFVWFPRSGTHRQLTDENLYRDRLNSTKDYVILSNPYSYGQQDAYFEEVDYYIKDVKTGSVKLLLAKQSHDENLLRFSPFNNLLLYYRDKNWWLHNPENDYTVNLTKNISTSWDNREEVPHQFMAYGCAGWTWDHKSVLLYDAYDIWKVALDGSQKMRLTHGREEEVRYRICKSNYGNQSSSKKSIVNLNSILLEGTNTTDWSMGYAEYSNANLRMLVYGPKYLTNFTKLGQNHYLYISETYSQPPQLEVVHTQTSKNKTLFKSNKQQAQFFWGKSDLIRYKNSRGESLKAALFYPAAFDEKKKYPMIVKIYDQSSRSVNHYVNPTLNSEEGIAVSNYTSRGYFVLLPDISYVLGAPGTAATDCVSSAVIAAKENGFIDDGKIGLIGHSFGGYETDFILTQSNIFAAAVSGAGISNPVGRYFDVGKSITGQSEMWRFENQQMRMGSSFFDNKQAYLNNSPVTEADKIHTPLLLWAGKKDRVIPFEQSISLYLALRRLSKPTIMLLYPNEAHTFETSLNQKDLSRRIAQWFDYYLKDSKDVQWIVSGTSTEK